jgi:hypothetical protein
MNDKLWLESFQQSGYAHFPHLIDAKTITAARNLIDRDLAENYDPARQSEYDNQSFCPGIRSSREIMALLAHPQVQRRIDDLVSLKELGEVDSGQIAIRKAHNTDRPYPPHPHIDGIPTPHNGVVGDEITPFTMLVCVFLSEVSADFAGNFTIWPGSHRLLETYFRQSGRASMRAAMPQVQLGNPVQLLCSPGDVILCHYQLAHTAAVNLSDNDRYAVFFRLGQKELYSGHNPGYRECRWQHLTHIWTGWKIAS